jgi:hypothetical protein
LLINSHSTHPRQFCRSKPQITRRLHHRTMQEATLTGLTEF